MTKLTETIYTTVEFPPFFFLRAVLDQAEGE